MRGKRHRPVLPGGHQLIDLGLQGIALLRQVVALREGLLLLIAKMRHLGLQGLQPPTQRSDLLARGDQLRSARRSGFARGRLPHRGLLSLGEFRLEGLKLTLLFGEAGIKSRLLLLATVKRVLKGLQIDQVGLARLQAIAEGIEGLPVATKGGLLFAERVQASGELPLGFIETGGLLNKFLLAQLDLPVELAVAGFKLLAEFRLAALEVLSLAGEFPDTVLVRIQLPGTSLQVCFAAVERGQTLPARVLLGGAALNQRLNLALPLENALLARFELSAKSELLLLNLIELSGPLGEVLFPSKEDGALGIQTVRTGAFLRFEALALLLQGLDSGIEFLLAGIQFDLETIQGNALLPELALVGGQLDFVLLEPPHQALILTIRGRRRGLLLGV
jgi:hypothetical protein